MAAVRNYTDKSGPTRDMLSLLLSDGLPALFEITSGKLGHVLKKKRDKYTHSIDTLS
jgi:hypothetical protein